MKTHLNDAPLLKRLEYPLYCLKQRVTYRIYAEGRASLKRLSGLKDSQRGKRCFIIGNGPSLRQTDLTMLREETTFGLNRIYLLFPRIGFNTTFLVAVNRLVLEQCAEEILELPNTKFIPWSFLKALKSTPHPDTVFIPTGCGKSEFVGDVRRPFNTGTTVTYVAMQIAYHMGFETVILVGVDHSFTTQGKPHETVVSQGDDPNHFAPNYFGKGFKWQLPDLASSEKSYDLARQAYEKAGRQILDATIGGQLNIFPKVNYMDLFK
jgi:hypothetical protein